MKEYPVSYKGDTFWVKVDDEDALKIDLLFGDKSRKLSYVPAWKNRGFRPAIWYDGKLRYLSRFLLGLLDPALSHLIVDHINQDPLDNRRVNLRVTNRQINALNTAHRDQESKSSKHRGVFFDNTRQQWVAHLTLKDMRTGKSRKHSRYCQTETEAVEKRRQLELEFSPVLRRRELLK